MAKSQQYPRTQDDLLDDSRLIQHTGKIPPEKLKEFIADSIKKAAVKSSRQMLDIPPDATEADIQQHYENAAWDLFKYFRKYAVDPAATAHQVYRKNYRDIGKELFRVQGLQRERMNSAWRYQYFVVDCASYSGRFRNVSDIGLREADFNAIIDTVDADAPPVYLYVSVKNRSNTMGGQDWPKAMKALEDYAQSDKNRVGPYCCVFGIAMESGTNSQKHKGSKDYSSDNIELWLSNYFWPFFTNHTYEEIMAAFLDVLLETFEADDELPLGTEIPGEVIDIFGYYCEQAGLLDESGYFNDPHKLVKFLCSERLPVRKRKPTGD